MLAGGKARYVASIGLSSAQSQRGAQAQIGAVGAGIWKSRRQFCIFGILHRFSSIFHVFVEPEAISAASKPLRETRSGSASGLAFIASEPALAQRRFDGYPHRS